MLKTIRHWGRILRAPIDRRQAFRRLAEFHGEPRSLEEKVDWAMQFGGRGLYRILTLQLKSEILALAREVAALHPEVILEIGTARGGTLLLWSQLATQRVISCDLRDLTRHRAVYEAFPPPLAGCRVELFSGNSHDPAFRHRIAAALAGQPVDFLFIDGDHTTEGVARDFQEYRPLVRPGGLIAFHDIVARQVIPTNQVHAFWQTLREHYPVKEFIDHPDQIGFGIGVVRV